MSQRLAAGRASVTGEALDAGSVETLMADSNREYNRAGQDAVVVHADNERRRHNRGLWERSASRSRTVAAHPFSWGDHQAPGRGFFSSACAGVLKRIVKRIDRYVKRIRARLLSGFAVSPPLRLPPV